MVGVPRSKGCRNCVQRRIKCDQTRPICNRCQKRGLECPGYDTPLKFQDEGEKLRQRYERKPAQDHNSSTGDVPELSNTSTPSPWTPYLQSDPPTPSAHSAISHRRPRGPEHDSEEPNHEYYVYDPEATTICSPDLFQAQLLGVFIGAVVPKLGQVPPRYRLTTNWLQVLAEQPGIQVSNALSSSIRALTLSHAGITLGSNALLETSRLHYGRALSQLARIFRQSPDGEGMSSGTLSATMLLSYYEMFHSTKCNGWVRHAGGAGALIRARGPSMTAATTFDRVMFMAYRHALIIHAFESNTDCFLTEPAWVETCRQIEEEFSDGTEFDVITRQYLEEMAQFPGLVSRARALPSVAEQARSPLACKQCDELKFRIARHRDAFKKLFARVSLFIKENGMETTTRAANEPDEVLFPNQFYFSNMYLGSFHCGYWTCLTILNVTLIEILRDEDLAETMRKEMNSTTYEEPPRTDIPGPAGRFVPPVPLHRNLTTHRSNEELRDLDDLTIPDPSVLRLENIQNATNSCRSKDHMLCSSFHGPFFLTFALRISLLAFPGQRERAWVSDQLRKLGRTFGMAGDIEDEVDMRKTYEEVTIEKMPCSPELSLGEIESGIVAAELGQWQPSMEDAQRTDILPGGKTVFVMRGNPN